MNENHKYFEEYYNSDKEKLDNIYQRMIKLLPFVKDKEFRSKFRNKLHKSIINKLIILCVIFIIGGIIYTNYSVNVNVLEVAFIETLGIILSHYGLTSKERWELFKLDLVDYMETKEK